MSVDHPNITKLYLALRVIHKKKLIGYFRTRKIYISFTNLFSEALYQNLSKNSIRNGFQSN